MRALFLVLLALLAQVILADDDTHPFKSTHYGCPDECYTQENPKCEISIPSNNFFVALHPNYFEHKVNGKFRYCEHYYVGMIIDKEMNTGKYKMVRGKVVDQCGTCAETQVDLSQPMFETLAAKKTGVIPMLFVILDKDTSEIIDGPHYNSDSLKNFSSQTGISREDIMESFKQAAKNMNQNGEKGLSEYPWESSKVTSKKTTTTTKKTTTTTKKTTTTTKKTTTTTTKKTTTTTSKKTTTTTSKKTTTTTSKKTTTTSTKKTTTTTSKEAKLTTLPPRKTTTVETTVSKTEPTTEPTVVDAPIEKEPIEPVPISQEEAHIPDHVDLPEHVEEPEQTEQPKQPKQPEQPKTPAKKPENELDDFDKANGGTNAPVTATIITCSTLGAAGVGLLMLKRKSPQKYDDLKKKFPEAFGTVKRSLTRGASTIKRGVTRSVSRRGSNKRPTQVPTSYSFTLNNEDGLPRVAIYDDPCPTKTRGAQHW